MPRRLRIIQDGWIYHVLNRRAARLPLFSKEADFAAFEKVIDEVARTAPIRILSYCLMPNHWHMELWPERGEDLSRFMQRLTLTHMRRWHAHHGTAGTGPVYQGRFKSFPVENDMHALTVGRYIERNALRAGLVKHAEDWRWCSLWRRENHTLPTWLVPIESWPMEAPPNWIKLVNTPQTVAEEEAMRMSIRRGAPFGDEKWKGRAAARMKLQSSLRDPWRPKKRK